MLSPALASRAPRAIRLAAEEVLPRQRVDFADLLVGHGVTCARGAVAMNYQKPAMAVIGAVIAVREAGIDRRDSKLEFGSIRLGVIV